MSLPEDNSERAPVSAPVDQPRERAGLSIGRIINGAILLIHVATFITALCVIGLVGNLMGRIAGVHPPPISTQTGTCPFYVGQVVIPPSTKPSDSPSKNYYPLGPNGMCLWFIAGHTILAIASIVFFVVGIVRIVFAMNIGFGTIVELIATPILFLLAFAVAVTLSIGIDVTCGNVATNGDTCDQSTFPTIGGTCGNSDTVCWHSAATQAQAAAWIIHIFFIVFFAVNIVRLIIFIRRRREERRRRQLLDYDTSEDPPPAPV